VTARLWVTGVGLVTALGAGVEATWSGLVRGQRAIRSATLFDTSGQRVGLVAQAPEVVLPDSPPELGGQWSRTSALACTAAREAIRGADLDVRRARVGLVVGGTTGGMFETEELLARLHGSPELRGAFGEMRCHPLMATGDRIDETLGPFVRVRSLSSACSSGANALVVAAGWLRSGEVDAVVAGGSDGLCRLTLSGFNSLAVIDPEPCRPFDRRRRGTNLGEGSGFVVLETANRARGRGVQPVAELAGWALGSEAHHITNPAPDAAVVAGLIGRALARAGLSARDVDYINAHATGTPASDVTEAAALNRALGSEARRIPVSSSKAQIGHTLGAAGAIEAVIAALVVQRKTIVPTAGLEQPDPACDLVHVPHVGVEIPRARAVLSNAFGFGGMDTVLVLCDPEIGLRATGEATRISVPGTGRAGLASLGASEPPVVTGVAVFGPSGLLGISECAALVDARGVARGGVDPDPLLDPSRARRLDRAARLGAVVAARAAAEATVPLVDVGMVLGSAFGNVDESAAFMHRVFEKGPRSASPAEFPNLVPSSPVGHVTIYSGSHGPAFAVTDLATSGESAFAQAFELVNAEDGPAIIAGAAEPRSDIVARVLCGLFAHAPSQVESSRVDLAAAVVIERADAPRTRGTPPLARVTQVLQWRADATAALAALRPPGGGRTEVVLPRTDGGVFELLDQTAWRASPRLSCAPGLGESDALGAVAIAVASARVGRGRARAALVVGLARGRGYAIVLEAA
jgi:3-oxoacyl-[acyl-carrier-protein] synthase II